MADETCPLCRKPATKSADAEWYRFACDRCGRFKVSEDLILNEFRLSGKPAARLSGVTRNAFEGGATLELTTTNFESLAATTPATNDVETKAKLLLRHLVRRSKSPGESAELDLETDYPLCHAASDGELHFLLVTLKERGWIKWTGTSGPQRLDLTAAGWSESARAPRELSEKAFVAMWFDDRTIKAWLHGIKPAIEQCGYRPVRMDAEEHNEMIDDQIQAEIRESRFLVADLTGQRPGVYFEAGLAIGRQIPVIWIRDKNDAGDTHFDTRQYNRIEYETPFRLCEALDLRIRATIGRGPLNPRESAS